MHPYFCISFCIGPFPNLNEDIISQNIFDLVNNYGLDEFGSLWSEFSFGEELIEEASGEVKEEDVLNQTEEWLKQVRFSIAKKILSAAKQVYLEETNEATQAVLDGKSWIFSGGQTWDGETTEIAEAIKIVRWSGLDEKLYKRLKE